MEFKEKKNSNKRLIVVSIILLAVAVFAYFDREKFCWALFIIGCIAYGESTKAAAVLICLIIHLIGVAALIWVFEENEKNKVEDTRPYYNILAPSQGIVDREELEHYSEFYSIYNPLKKK